MGGRKHSKDVIAPAPEPVAGNGLLDRRALLGQGIALAGAVGVGGSLTGAAAEPLSNGPWSLGPGVAIPPYGQPSKYEQKVVRTLSDDEVAGLRSIAAHYVDNARRYLRALARDPRIASV